MTVVTLGRRWYMVCRLTGSEIAIVAVGAGTGHATMAEPHIGPVTGGQVTDVTLLCGRNVIGRFSCCQGTVVAI
jgi:hypothetical protein